MHKINFAQRSESIVSVFSEAEYMDFSKLARDLVTGKLEKYSAGEANAVILKKMRQVAELGEDPTAYEVRKAMKKSTVREGIFEILSETVEDTLVTGWQANPFWQKYVEYKSLKLGQTNSFYIPDTTDLVVSEVAPSNHDITRQRLGSGKEFGVSVKNYGAKVYMEAERYLMGVEDWAALVEKISKAYTQLINTLISTQIMSAGATLPNPTQWNITCQMTAADKPKLIKLCSDVAIGTGSQPIIMGTAVALSGLTNMYDVDWLPNSAKEDIYTMGRVGQFGQYSVVEIPQAFAPKDSTSYLVPDDKLLIMPMTIDKFVKFFDEGDTDIYEVTDRDTHVDHTFDYEMVRRFGVQVLTNVRFGTVTVTA